MRFTRERVSGNELKLERQLAGETPALPGLEIVPANLEFKLIQWCF